MSNKEVKFRRALPTQERRKKHIAFRFLKDPTGAEFAMAMTDTTYEPHQLRFAGEAHAGYVSNRAPSLTTREDLIERLAERIVLYLSHYPSHHLEIIIGFSNEENAKHQVKLKSMIMQAILAFNRHEISQGDILRIYTINLYMQILKNLAIISPNILKKK